MDSGSEAFYAHRVAFDFSCLFSENREEFNSLNTSCGVKGRLSAAVDFWKSTFNAPEFVVGIITHWYRLSLPFMQYLPPCFLASNRSTFQHPEFLSQAICELLENDCIVEHCTPLFCVNPLSVAEWKKLRLVLSSLSQVLEEGHWFFKKELRSEYHHVDICVEHQTYLGFSRFQWRARIFYLCSFAFLP